jgi:hypothetical protein
MPPNLVPWNNHLVTRPSRRDQAMVRSMQAEARIEMLDVHRRAVVAATKAEEVDRLTRVAINGHAQITTVASTLAGADPLLADDLKFFTDLSRLGKAEILTQFIADLGREL